MSAAWLWIMFHWSGQRSLTRCLCSSSRRRWLAASHTDHRLKTTPWPLWLATGWRVDVKFDRLISGRSCRKGGTRVREGMCALACLADAAAELHSALEMMLQCDSKKLEKCDGWLKIGHEMDKSIKSDDNSKGGSFYPCIHKHYFIYNSYFRRKCLAIPPLELRLLTSLY